MIKSRIAGTAALVTFGLAALGGTVTAIAAPANAAPASSGNTSSSDTSSASPTSDKTSTPDTSTSRAPSGQATTSPGPQDVLPYLDETRRKLGLQTGSTSKVGSAPSSSVSSSGGALTSSTYADATDPGTAATPFAATDDARLASLNNNLQADMAMIASMLDKMNQLYSTIARIGS